MNSKKVTRIDVNQESGQYVGVVNIQEDEDVMVTVKSKDYAFNSQYISSDDKVIFISQADLDFEDAGY